jgi:signal transduction histidine kinase
VTEHPAYHQKFDRFNGTAPRSLACVPVTFQDQVMGVVTLFDKMNDDFGDTDILRLESFARPVATAIQNAHLFQDSEQQRMAILATAQTLEQPLIILDKEGKLLIANEPAQKIIDAYMPALFAGISNGIGRTVEITIGDETYLTSAQHVDGVGTIIVMQNITYVKRLEKDRADFMRALSHDLKSPLTSIRGFAQLLERAAKLDETGKRFINRIVTSSDRMLDMINQLLLVSRSEVVEIERSVCSLTTIIHKVLVDVEGAALFKEIEIIFKEEGKQSLVLADELRLLHMILNLVDNAIKYAPSKTHVYITLAFYDKHIVITVRDEGAGIPEDELGRVFDRYFRSERTRDKPGAGVGLSVVQAIAHAHEGKTAVRNHPKGGAEFSIILPSTLCTTEPLES